MVTPFSRRVGDTMESFIMGLVEVAARPGMISFATGLPDNDLFGTDALVIAVGDVLREDPSGPLQYDTASGFIPLREYIADRCRDVLGVDATYEDVIMTNGSQECFDQLGKMFLDRGDGMVVENPGYLGAIQSFSAYGPRFTGVDVGTDGVDVVQLEEALSHDPKLFYSIPNHQNPSGNSYSDAVRVRVADLVRGSGCLMIEDDAYGELGYGGRVGRTMKSMAPDDVVLTGSFSKTISPGMRVGWMVVPEWMRAETNRNLEASCLQSNTFCQRVVHRFLLDNDYDLFLDGLRRGYMEKKRIFLEAMEENLPGTMRWNDPDGGMFVWLRSPDGTDATALFEGALDEKLVVMPGKPFHVRGGANTVRLNFATPSEEQIHEGMRRLGRVCRRLYPE